MSAALIASYVDKGYFEEGVCRPPQGEETPVPVEGECVVFRNLFVTGLHFPWTPNSIVQLSKNFWVVRTFGGPISVDAFCRLYELHP